MKKIFTLIALAVAFVSGVQAQTITINKVDGSKVTYNASDISSIEFGAKADTTVLHSFEAGSAYLLVSSDYFKNDYYGQNSTMTVLQTGDKENPQYLAKFDDPTWGTGLFNITMGKGTISGTGKLEVSNPHGGSAASYDATMSGTMKDIKINVTMGRMGNVVINWVYGDPGAYKLAGNYAGEDSLIVGGAYKYVAVGTPTYQIKAVSADTISVTVPAEEVKGTMMGDLSLSSYTIDSLVWNATQKAYVRDYKNDGVTFHFTAESNGTKTIDSDYTMGRDRDGNPSKVNVIIAITPNEDGTISISNQYGMGNMPFGVENRMVKGEKQEQK